VNKPTFEDINKAIQKVPLPTCYADYTKTYNILPDGEIEEIKADMKFWPEGAPENELAYSFEYTVNPWPAGLKLKVIPKEDSEI
jgi:hypothetical protein